MLRCYSVGVKRFLLNLWNAQRNADDLTEQRQANQELRRLANDSLTEAEKFRDLSSQSLTYLRTVADEYWRSIGQPVGMEKIPVSIQEAHAFIGASYGWKPPLGGNRILGEDCLNRQERKKMAIKKQWTEAGLGDWEGFKQ